MRGGSSDVGELEAECESVDFGHSVQGRCH